MGNKLTKEEIKKLIVSRIKDLGGIKATELVADQLIVDASLKSESPPNFVVWLNELVDEERIIEIEYILPSMPDRVKSFLLPGLPRQFGID